MASVLKMHCRGGGLMSAIPEVLTSFHRLCSCGRRSLHGQRLGRCDMTTNQAVLLSSQRPTCRLARSRSIWLFSLSRRSAFL